jgi:nitronate monooxygenase
VSRDAIVALAQHGEQMGLVELDGKPVTESGAKGEILCPSQTLSGAGSNGVVFAATCGSKDEFFWRSFRGGRAMSIQNRLTQMLRIQHPVLLAPMDLVSGGRLAAAVSQAGGLGLLGGGYGDGDWIDREWGRSGNARIGCGFITWSLAKHPHVLDRALARRPVAVMLSFGDPRPFASAIRTAGAVLICQVQTVSQAREAVEAGSDVIVAQGTEAGGHGMSEPLFTLLPQVADACPDTLVVAAGGIADGRGLASALMLGAEGVLMGTRFYASQEADGHPEAKRRIVEAQGGQTVRSIVFDLSRRIRWPAAYTGRLLRNRHAETWLGRENELEARMEEVGREYAAAREHGNFDVAGVIAGESCALIHDIPPAGEIVERVIAEAERLIGSRGGAV